MKTTQRKILILALIGSFIAGVAGAQEAPGSLFNGEPRRFVVNGYSTSFDWPEILQRKLNRYFDGKQTVEVVSAVKGLTPIAKWMDIETGDKSPAWEQILTPAIKGAGDEVPVYVLAQQSLQWVWGDRASGIRNDSDAERIDRGVEVLDSYTRKILEDGASGVVIAMHIYKDGMEPEIGNECLALAKFIESKPESVTLGPDLWTPTSKVWPQAFKTDKVHPNLLGAEIMAHYWFARLLEIDGRVVPDWSESEMKDAAKNPADGAGPGGMTRGAGQKGGRGSSLEAITERHDKDGDGVVTREEFSGPANAFNRIDKNQDGKIAADDFESTSSLREPAVEGADASHGELSEFAATLGGARVSPQMLDKYGHEGIEVGSVMPEIEVYSPQGKAVQLSRLWESRPTVLVAASVSCGPSCQGLPDLGAIAEHFGEEVWVAVLYVVEAHPSEGDSPYNGGGSGRGKSKAKSPSQNGISQPGTIEERLANARQLISRHNPKTPVVIDNIENDAWRAVGEGPNIAVLIGQGGILLERQGWFDARKMTQLVADHLQSAKK